MKGIFQLGWYHSHIGASWAAPFAAKKLIQPQRSKGLKPNKHAYL